MIIFAWKFQATSISDILIFFYQGYALDVIISQLKSAIFLLFILFLVIAAFTQAFMVLLYFKDDSYFQDSFFGDFTSNITLTTGNITIEGLTRSANVSADNAFVNWFKAFSQIWFFIFGVWDLVNEGDIGDDKMVISMRILCSFSIVLVSVNAIP